MRTKLRLVPGLINPAHKLHYSSSPRPPPPPVADLAAILSTPTWSIRSLLPPSPNSTSPATSTTITPPSAPPTNPITPSKLHHLLHLSSLPPPTPAATTTLLKTLQSHLHFLHTIHTIDTTSIPPLVAIRDETPAGISETTIHASDLEPYLAAEAIVGYNKRPRRRKEKEATRSPTGDEEWDPLGTAPRVAGRYFVVEAGAAGLKGGE